MFREVFRKVIALASQPQKTWETLVGEGENEEHEKFLSNFVYPLIGLVAVAAFVGVLFSRREFDVELALKASVRDLASSLFGFFLASYFLNELWGNFFNRDKDSKLCQRFIGYSSSLMFVLNIVLALLPEFFFLRIFVLYIVYIVWEGAVSYMKVEDSERLKFTGITSALIIVAPVVIRIVLVMLMPGLHF